MNLWDGSSEYLHRTKRSRGGLPDATQSRRKVRVTSVFLLNSCIQSLSSGGVLDPTVDRNDPIPITFITRCKCRRGRPVSVALHGRVPLTLIIDVHVESVERARLVAGSGTIPRIDARLANRYRPSRGFYWSEVGGAEDYNADDQARHDEGCRKARIVTQRLIIQSEPFSFNHAVATTIALARADEPSAKLATKVTTYLSPTTAGMNSLGIDPL